MPVDTHGRQIVVAADLEVGLEVNGSSRTLGYSTAQSYIGATVRLGHGVAAPQHFRVTQRPLLAAALVQARKRRKIERVLVDGAVVVATRAGTILLTGVGRGRKTSHLLLSNAQEAIEPVGLFFGLKCWSCLR